MKENMNVMQMDNEDDTTVLSEETMEELSCGSSLNQYLREIGTVPLLNWDEEQELSACVKCGLAAEEQLKNEANPVWKAELLRYIQSGVDAQRKLVVSNLRLAVLIANKYKGRGLSMEDLIQEGGIGLMKAAARYDADTGNRFSTYASWWIRQGISRAITNQGRMIRLPSHMIQQVTALHRAEQKLAQQLGREATELELAEELKADVAKVHQLKIKARDVSSLDAPLNDGEDSSTVGDLTADEFETDRIEEQMTHNALKSVLSDALTLLDERERLVITMRYGIGTGSCATLEEISKALGLTRERVRQIEARALRRLRTGANSDELIQFIA